MATVTEIGIVKPRHGFDMGVKSKGMKALGDIVVPKKFFERMSFGGEVMDSLINGDGLIAGQRITCSAPRGSGKTTFWLQTLEALIVTNQGIKAGYISNEEDVTQLAYTAQRINTINVCADNMSDIDEIAELMKTLDVLVIDSIAGLTCSHIRSPVLREEYACNTLNQSAQENDCAVIYIQHFTKGGEEKGGSHWGHAVDMCMQINKLDIEDYGENCRMISVEKNRFGSQAEVILKLTREGFDFTTPIENHTSGNDCNKGQGVYINRKLQDNKAIMVRVKEKSAAGAKIQDFADLNIDMGRIERLLKELANRGKIVRSGGGKGASKDTIRYFLGDTEPSDFGESDE